jgi:hypothetical protein
VRIIQDVPERKVLDPIYKTNINGRRDPLRCPRDTLLSVNIGTNFANQRRPSVDIVRLRTKSHLLLMESLRMNAQVV